MHVLFAFPAILSLLALAAHFLRESSFLLTLLCLAVCLLLMVPRRWVARLAQATLALGALVWLYTTLGMIQMRVMEHRDWKRAAIILASVAAISLLAALLFQTKTLKTYYAPSVPREEPVNA